MSLKSVLCCLLVMLLAMPVIGMQAAHAGDQPQWGERYSRNMVSSETGLPTAFDPKTGDHILWSAQLGDHTYSSPIVANGKVFIGDNNAYPRDPKHKGDRGVLLCLNENDGSLCWQLVSPRIEQDYRMDWPEIGFCSPPTIEDGRVYVLTNRYEVACLDLAGLANGNDGPFTDEGRRMTPREEAAMEPGPTDADILWLFDIPKEIGIYMHDAAYASILLDGPYLYLNTCNGVDNPSHEYVQRPDAKSLIVLDKNTGKLVAQENEGMANRMFHSTWSSPSLGVVNGQRLIFFGGPDGMCYAFRALTEPVPETVQNLEVVWRFDYDPTAPKDNFKKYVKNIHESPSDMFAMPVFFNNRLYITMGGDIWWGKRQSWMKCIDATQTGDVTKTAELWSHPLERHVLATPSIYNGLAFAADSEGNLHCVNADTGEMHWIYKAGNEIWASPLCADGKVFIGARDGTFTIAAAEKTQNILATIKFDAEIAATATAANGTLYIATLSRLYAIK